MSWIERLENIEFSITTGDGRVFTPLWKNGEKSKEYNVSNYNFINVSGGFSDRKQPKASKYPLIFWFQGDDNIEQAQRFEESADDPRPWTVKHPFYGNISGQPLSIKRNDVNYNTTEVTVEFWESVNEDYPNPTPAINDVITNMSIEASQANITAYATRINPRPEDQQIIQQNITQTTSNFNKLYDNENFAEYQNDISTANNAASDITSESQLAVEAIHNLYIQPSLFVKPVGDKITAFVAAFSDIKQTLEEFPTNSTKLFFESIGAACILSMCRASVNPIETDYVTRLEVQGVTSNIVNVYNEYLQLLDENTVSISDVENSYSPDPISQLSLSELVNETIGNLFILAFEAKQLRITQTETDTNLILLTHRYLGLNESDQNIEDFRELNNIKNNELFNIKKGREIMYFV